MNICLSRKKRCCDVERWMVVGEERWRSSGNMAADVNTDPHVTELSA
jgi:hypothetical protein